MRRIFGLILAGGMLFGFAGRADAQMNVPVVPPYGGGVAVGAYPYGAVSHYAYRPIGPRYAPMRYSRYRNAYRPVSRRYYRRGYARRW